MRNAIARQIFLCCILFATLPVLSQAGNQEAAPSSNPGIEFTVQSGHTAEIEALEYAADSKFFVTGSKDSTIKLWSPTGTLIRSIRTGFWVNYLALSHDDQSLLAASRTGYVFLLSLDGHVIHRFPNIPMSQGFVSALAIANDNHHFAIGTTRGLVIYRLDGTAETRVQPEGDSSEVASVIYTPDGNLITGHPDGKLRFWTGDGKLLRTVAAHEYSVQALTLSPDGKTLATAGSPAYSFEISKNIKPVTKLWDLDGKQLAQFPSQLTRSLRFSADGTTLVSGGLTDGLVNIYQKSGEVVRTIKVGVGDHRSPYLVALAPDGQTLITADDNIDPPGLLMWNTDGTFGRAMLGLSGPMTNVVTSPDGNFIVTLSADRFVRIWSLTGRLLASLAAHKEYPTGLAYAPNGQYFASGGDNVILWSRLGQKLDEFTGFRNNAGVLAFSPDSRYLFCGDGGGYVHIFDLQQKSVRHLKVHDGRVFALAIHPSGKYFATSSMREDVRIWDIDGKLQGESRFDTKVTRPVGPAYSLAFSPEGDKLVAATANPEKTLQIFDLKAQPLDAIKVPNFYMGGAIAFSKSGKLLAATTNNTITLLDWPTHNVVRVLKGHTDNIEALSFTPDDNHLVTAGHDATTRVWRIDNGYSMALLAHGGDWIMYSPDGYFDSSHYGGDLVGITKGLDTFAIDQFALKLNRPDIILSRLGLGSPEFIEHLHSRYESRLQRSGFQLSESGFSLQAPEARLIDAKQDGKFAQIHAEFSDQHYPLQSYQIYVNNVPVFHGQGKPIAGLDAKVSEQIELSQGLNKIEVSAFNSQGVEAIRAHWSTIYRPSPQDAKGDLYYIGFGVSHYQNPALNLQFAHKDVLDLGAALERYKGAFRNVFIKTYTDDAATRNNILKAGEFLKNAGVDDTVVILVSGHGTYDLSQEATYYYGTYNIDVKHLAATAVSFEEIESLLRDIAPRRKLLLLDTCESGEMDDATRTELLAKIRNAGLSARTSGVFQQAHAGQPKRVYLYERDRYIYNDLQRRSGSIVFSASHAGEMSLESPKIQNGFFTHEVLEALSSKEADSNHDGQISVDELEAFVSLRVGLMTSGLQRPTVDRDNINQRFGFPLLH